MVEHAEQVVDERGRADALWREAAGAAAAMVEPDAPPAAMHQLERLLPQLPVTDPPAVCHERRAGAELDRVQQVPVSRNEHLANLYTAVVFHIANRCGGLSSASALADKRQCPLAW